MQLRDVAIIGCGMTKFGRLEGKGLMDLLAEASLRAINDAGAGDRDFDAVYVANFAAGELTRQSAIASALGFEAARGVDRQFTIEGRFTFFERRCIQSL